MCLQQMLIVFNFLSALCAQMVEFGTPTKNGLYQSCIKNCEISNFGFLANLVILFSAFNMGVNGEL